MGWSGADTTGFANTMENKHMSQQEMVPESQSNQQQSSNEDELYYPQHPYYWSTTPGNTPTPRDESPLNYDESLMDQSYREQSYQEGYLAQDQPAQTKQQDTPLPAADPTQANTGRQSLARQQPQLGSDGDAFEQGYRPYRGYNRWQGVPPWTRVQPRQRGSARIIMFIIAGIFLIKPLLALFGFLFAAIGIAAVAFALIVVAFVFLLPIIALLAALARGAGWSGRRQRRWRYFNYWRRPGPWRW